MGGECLFSSLCLWICNHGCRRLHGLFFPIYPPVGKTRTLFSLEKYQVFEASPISLRCGLLVAQSVEELDDELPRARLRCSSGSASRKCLALPSGSCGARIKAGSENDKSALLRLLRFQSLFGFNVATKGKAFECCLQHKHVLKHLILDRVGGDQPSSYQYVKWLKTALG